MPLRISGKNVDIGQALREHITGRVSEALGKFFDGGYTGHVVVEREGSGYAVDANLHLSSGTILQSTGTAHEVYAAADQAVERIAARLRRYKRKLKKHHAAVEGGREGDRFEPIEAQAYVLAAPDEEEELPEDFAPVVVAETTQKISTATVGRAVMDLDLSGAPVVVFRNAGTGAINVVYRRPDGNIGWIDPTLNELAG
jgi:ribosomal subunit interface protein